MEQKLKGIMFDMDNTLLQSNIDFPEMKAATYCYLVQREVLPNKMNLHAHTTSTIIEEAIRTNKMTEELLREMWEIPKKYEIEGMRDAALEPGARDVLNILRGGYHLVIVTNNSVEAAKTALNEHHILEYFDLVVGREYMKTMKPSPDGYLHVLRTFDSSAQQWISVGDSWIDGKGSAAAGIRFIAYKSDQDKLRRMQVTPYAEIDHLMGLITILEQES